MSDRDFSVESLIEWIETQPADMKYDWSSARNCLLGQWCRSKGMFGETLRSKSMELGKLGDFYDIALRDTSRITFGAALERAKALVPLQQRCDK